MENEENEIFEKNWASFIQSLDVGPEKAKGIEQLPVDQKRHLLESYVTKDPKCSAFHYVSLIKALRVGRSTLSKHSRRGEGQHAKEVLMATEISLRTNNVGWVYDFLDQNGLDVLVTYVSKVIHMLLRTNAGSESPGLEQPLISRESFDSVETLSRSLPSSRHKSNSLRTLWCIRGSTDGDDFSRRRSLDRPSRCTLNIPDSTRDSLHQAVKCFRALLNNQRGCSMVFDHPRAINVITLCLLHPSYQTKSLVLELLAAVCLIIGGHECVIKAFDNFKREVGESQRFESLVHYFFTHETLSSTDEYNVDFMVSCIQFFNIVVHSTDDIMLRVYLQEEFRHLGLVVFLQRLINRASDRLVRQIEAYNDNEVDVAMLLEDSQARELLQQELEQRETEVFALQTRLGSIKAEYEAQTTELRASLDALQSRCAELEHQRETQTGQLATLQSRLKDRDRSATDREKDLEARIQELEDTISRTKRESGTDKPTTPKLVNGNVPAVIPPPPTLAPAAPPPPPPPLLTAGIPPPPVLGGVPPPPPGLGQVPSGVEAVPIRPPIQTRFKLPLVNWTVLRSQQLRGTVFVGMNDEEVLNHVDTKRLEDLFKLSTQTVGSVSTDSIDGLENGYGKPAKRPEKKSLIDTNRHRCIGVLLRYLEAEKYTPERLWSEITRLEVSQDVADRIYHQLPTQDEMKTYLKYEFTDQLNVDELTDEDRLLLHLCKIERLSTRLEIVLFMNSFEDSMATLTPKIAAVSSVSLALKQSERFRAILELVLAFGNYINSSRRGIAYGFRLQSLDALVDTRSVDKSWTLLHYIVDTIQTRFPALATFYESFGDIATAAKVPMEALTSDVNALVSGLAQADKETIVAGPMNTPDRLTHFIEKNKPRVESIQQRAERAKTLFAQTVEWFGEAQNKPSPEQFFGLILRFVENFKKAVADNEKRHRMDALQMLQAVTGGHNGSIGQLTNTPGVPTKKPKDNMPSDLQRQLASEARNAKRRLKNRTRQITGDGMMDEILAGLISEPLQAEVHPRRAKASDEF